MRVMSEIINYCPICKEEIEDFRIVAHRVICTKCQWCGHANEIITKRITYKRPEVETIQIFNYRKWEWEDATDEI